MGLSWVNHRTPATLVAKQLSAMRIMKIRPIFLAICLTLCGTACVPLPIHQRSHSNLSGVLRSDGYPVAGIEVRTCLDRRPQTICERSASTSTDADGRFELNGASEFPAYLPLVGDFYTFYYVELTYREQLLRWNGVAEFPPPERIGLNCTIAEQKLSCLQTAGQGTTAK